MSVPVLIPLATAVFLLAFGWLLRRTVKQNLMNQNSLLMWFAVTGLLLVMMVFPREVIRLSVWMGFETAANAVFFFAIGFLMFLNLLQSLEICRINAKLVRLIQHVAIEQADHLPQKQKQ